MGQPSFSYPSFYPDYRVTGLERSADNKILWNLGDHTYMVAGRQSDDKNLEKLYNLWRISKLGVGRENLTSEQLANNSYPKALPMNCYKNGALIQSSHQGVFNDHR